MMSVHKFALIIFIFIVLLGCDSKSPTSDSQLSKQALISIAIEEARQHEDWEEFFTNGHVREAFEVIPSFDKGTSVVTVTGLPFGPGKEANVFIDSNGKVVGYLGGK
jgi:hypothetical protein